MILSETDT